MKDTISKMMKKETRLAFRLLAAMVFIVVAANLAGAQISESFRYTAGAAISGRNGGTGWAGAWSGGSGTITNSGLTYVGLPVTGNALGPSVAFPTRLFSQPITSCSVRMSVLIRSSTAGTPASQAVVGNFGAPIGNSFAIGDLPMADAQAGNWGMILPSGLRYYSNVPVTPNATVYLVLQIDFDYSGSSERFRLWVNPPALPNLATGTLPAVANATGFANLNSFNGILWQTQQSQVLDEIRVETIPCGCCDTMRVTPALNPPLNQSYRTFEIFNPSASSPICSIDINMTPNPHTTFWQGGQAFQNTGVGYPSTPVNFIFGSIPPAYRRLPTLAPNVMSAISNPLTSPAVVFNLGFDNTQAYNGTTTLTVNHCDGRKCYLEYTPWIVNPLYSDQPNTLSWRFNLRELSKEFLELTLTYDGGNGKSALQEFTAARWLGLSLPGESAEIYSIDGADVSGERAESKKLSLNSSKMTTNTALFEFSGLLEAGNPEQNGKTITLILKRNGGATVESKDVRLTLYDENANIIIFGNPQR
ncbi:MAG: hypothetical protein WA584_04050 [Pyrinomonadaceae bacterium]